MILLDSVSRSVGTGSQRRDLFLDLTVVAQDQKLTALIGRSGYGKSSLLEIAALERRPDTGAVRIDGQTVGLESQSQIAELKAQSVGYIPQAPNLCEFVSIKENMRLRIDLAGEDPELYESRISELAENLRISHLLDSRVSSLSGGERYRASLGRALVTNPSIIICDEPTAALDAGTSDDVISIIKSHASHKGNMALVATHDPTLIDAADTVVDMEQVV